MSIITNNRAARGGIPGLTLTTASRCSSAGTRSPKSSARKRISMPGRKSTRRCALRGKILGGRNVRESRVRC